MSEARKPSSGHGKAHKPAPNHPWRAEERATWAAHVERETRKRGQSKTRVYGRAPDAVRAGLRRGLNLPDGTPSEEVATVRLTEQLRLPPPPTIDDDRLHHAPRYDVPVPVDTAMSWHQNGMPEDER